jgi:hypothetical protein
MTQAALRPNKDLPYKQMFSHFGGQDEIVVALPG